MDPLEHAKTILKGMALELVRLGLQGEVPGYPFTLPSSRYTQQQGRAGQDSGNSPGQGTGLGCLTNY